MEDLREKTHSEHYEIFRRRRLQEMGFADTGADNQPVRYALLYVYLLTLWEAAIWSTLPAHNYTP